MALYALRSTMPTVSAKGQVTIPAEIRERLGIHPGDDVTFETTEQGYVLRKVPADDRFDEWHGAIDADESMADRMATLRDRPLGDTPEDDEDS